MENLQDAIVDARGVLTRTRTPQQAYVTRGRSKDYNFFFATDNDHAIESLTKVNRRERSHRFIVAVVTTEGAALTMGREWACLG